MIHNATWLLSGLFLGHVWQQDQWIRKGCPGQANMMGQRYNINAARDHRDVPTRGKQLIFQIVSATQLWSRRESNQRKDSLEASWSNPLPLTSLSFGLPWHDDSYRLHSFLEVLHYSTLWPEHVSKSTDQICQDSTRHVPIDRRPVPSFIVQSLHWNAAKDYFFASPPQIWKMCGDCSQFITSLLPMSLPEFPNMLRLWVIPRKVVGSQTTTSDVGSSWPIQTA